MERRKRRGLTKGYKAEVVELAGEGGKSIGAIANELDLTETAVRAWVRQAEVDAGRGPARIRVRGLSSPEADTATLLGFGLLGVIGVRRRAA